MRKKKTMLSPLQEKVVTALKAGGYLEEVLPHPMVIGSRTKYVIEGGGARFKEVDASTVELLKHMGLITFKKVGDSRRWIVCKHMNAQTKDGVFFCPDCQYSRSA